VHQNSEQRIAYEIEDIVCNQYECSNPIISACGCSMFIAFLHYFPNNLSNFAWRQPQRAAHRATITVKKTAHARHVSALRRSTVSHSLSSAHARSPANYTTPHHTTHTEQHTRFESASQSRAPTHTSAAAKSSFETEPSCAGTIRVGARIGPQWNRLCTENEIWTTHNINPEIRLFKLRSGFRRSESIVKTNLKNSIQILIL